MSDFSRQNGKRWEDYILAECEELARLGEAFVSKNWEAPPVPGQHVKREASKPDFSGFTRRGRHIVFEAKATRSTTALPMSSIAAHQWEYLDDACYHGAMSFVYVLDGLERKWVFPWLDVLEWREVRASIPFIEGRPCQKRDGETWLDVLLRLEAPGVS